MVHDLSIAKVAGFDGHQIASGHREDREDCRPIAPVPTLVQNSLYSTFPYIFNLIAMQKCTLELDT